MTVIQTPDTNDGVAYNIPAKLVNILQEAL